MSEYLMRLICAAILCALIDALCGTGAGMRRLTAGIFLTLVAFSLPIKLELPELQPEHFFREAEQAAAQGEALARDARAAVGESIIGRLKALFHWLLEWSLKLTLYIFTGYMAVTGVVSGSADAAAGKAARIAISGAVPVVGGILSDAADAVLLSASALGAGAGVWGILTVIALFCAPAVKIGCQYLMLKLTSAIAESLGGGRCGMLIGDFAGAMGLLLALVSTQAVLLLVSSLCFLKGVGG